MADERDMTVDHDMAGDIDMASDNDNVWLMIVIMIWLLVIVD